MLNEQIISIRTDSPNSLDLESSHKVLTSRRFMTPQRNLRKDFSFNISSVDFMENLVITRHEIEITEITINRFFPTWDNRNGPKIKDSLVIT